MATRLPLMGEDAATRPALDRVAWIIGSYWLMPTR